MKKRFTNTPEALNYPNRNKKTRVIFHDRRLQNTEAEQIESWSQANPGKRFIEIDKELSTEISCVNNKKDELNCSELVWASAKDAVVFIKVHCISTEFTQKKHGGEKGAPFRYTKRLVLF